MPEPRTHYQVSFTARQAVLLFAVFLAALAGAYFLGVATGIAGRPRGEPVEAGPSNPVPTKSAAPQKPPKEAAAGALPTPAPETRASPPPIAAREPSATGGIQFFEDRPEEATAAVMPAPKKAAAPAPATGGFWIQVLSTTSESEAKSRRTRLAARGYRAAVSPVHGAKGPTLYRVRIGPYSSKEEASKASEAIVRKEKVRTWIVPPGE